MKKIRKNIKKILTVYLVGMLFVLGNARYTYGFPVAPTAPTYEGTEPVAPEVPSEPVTPPEEPTAPEAPVSPEVPTAPEAPVYDSEPSDTEDPAVNDEAGSDPLPEESVAAPETSTPTETPPAVSGTNIAPSIQSTGGEESSGSMGSAVIATGDADNTGTIINTGAENYLTVGEDGYDGGIIITSSGNGSNSVNNGSLIVDESTATSQVNTTNVVNNMNSVSNSGSNEASENMGDAEIVTGDANVTGTIVNSVNTNVDGIMVSEFNIVDDHIGDIILDFSSECISGCGDGEDITLANTDNGSDSVNTTGLEVNTNDITFQQNDANIENNMILEANTGDNEAEKNMGGVTIATGDANVEASIINFVNNNIAGDVVYAVVNIFGDLVGDIIIPEALLNACCGGSDITLANSGNGTDSVNTVNADIDNSQLIEQFNNAVIDNNLIFDANTGDNELSKVMGGDTGVTTGNAEIVTKVLNIANTNIIGGNAWLVIVNEAGKWIGKILGGDGTNLAGSEGFEFIVNDAGDVLAVNSGNGADSTNTTNLAVNNNETFTQINNANIVNNVKLSANTGGNEAEKNMNGSEIVTGDAKIVANIVNFVNNNIIGQGKLFVTVVNVFGSWLGDLVTPGHEKNVADESGTGGVSEPTASSGSTAGSTSNSSGNSSDPSDSSPSDENSVPVIAAGYIFNKARVLGRSIILSEETEGDSLLAEDSADMEAVSEALGKKSVKINLAYGLFLIPLALGYIIIRRRRLLLLNA